MRVLHAPFRPPSHFSPLRRRAAASALTLLVCLANCDRHRGPSSSTPRSSPLAAAATDSAHGGVPTSILMRDVDLVLHPGIVLQVHDLAGNMLPVEQGLPVRLDDPASFTIQVQSGTAAIDYEDLSDLMNEVVFAYPGAPLKGLHIEKEEADGENPPDTIELKLHLANAPLLPIEIEGRPEITPDGQLRVRTTSIQGADIPVDGLLDLLGIEAENVVGGMEEHGVLLDGNDVILRLDRILPPPRVEAPLQSITVRDDHLDLVLGRESPHQAAAGDSANYLWFTRNRVQLGRVTMTDADLRIVDNDPRDPFDFSMNELTEQLIAGYAKLGRNGGLTAYVPDRADMAGTPQRKAMRAKSNVSTMDQMRNDKKMMSSRM